jgi:YD repeat-containing protein
VAEPSALAETTRYFYDELNRLQRIEYSDGTVIEYDYDKSGNRIAHRYLVLGVDLITTDVSGRAAPACDNVGNSRPLAVSL